MKTSNYLCSHSAHTDEVVGVCVSMCVRVQITHKEIFWTNIHNFKEVPFINFPIVLRVIIFSVAPSAKRPLASQLTIAHTSPHSRADTSTPFYIHIVSTLWYPSPSDPSHRSRIAFRFIQRWYCCLLAFVVGFLFLFQTSFYGIFLV